MFLDIILLRLSMEQYKNDKSMKGRFIYLWNQFKYYRKCNKILDMLSYRLKDQDRGLYDIMDEYIHHMESLIRINPNFNIFNNSISIKVKDGIKQMALVLNKDKEEFCSMILEPSTKSVQVSYYSTDLKGNKQRIDFDIDNSYRVIHRENNTQMNYIKDYIVCNTTGIIVYSANRILFGEGILEDGDE